MVDHGLDLGVPARMERLECSVLELPLDRMDTQAVRQRGVDLERLARLGSLLLLGQRLDRAHVVQAVGELDQHDAHVLRHRHDHLAIVLGLGLLAAREVDLGELCDALDQQRDLVAELLTHLVQLGVRVLDHVVHQRRRDGR